MCIVIVAKGSIWVLWASYKRSFFFFSAVTKTRGSTIAAAYFFLCHSRNHLLLSPAPVMRVSDEHLLISFLCRSQYFPIASFYFGLPGFHVDQQR